MSNKQQTAVEWLVSNISSKIDNEYWCNQKEITEWVEQAKAMEKDQHSETFNQGVQWMQYQRDLVNGGAEYWDKVPSHFGEYYNETFGSPE